MNAIQLTDLETQVDHLIESIVTLRDENTSLKQRLTTCVRERAQLQERNHKATTQIKQIIRQLKEEMA